MSYFDVFAIAERYLHKDFTENGLLNRSITD